MKLFCWRNLRDPQKTRDPRNAAFLQEGRKLSKKVTVLAIRYSVKAIDKIDFFQNPGGVLLNMGPTPGTPGTVQIHESRLYVYDESKKRSFLLFSEFSFVQRKVKNTRRAGVPTPMRTSRETP